MTHFMLLHVFRNELKKPQANTYMKNSG